MGKVKVTRGVAGRIAVLERRLVELEGRLIDVQAEYEDSSRELTELRALSRRLADWGLKASDTGTWIGVCNAIGWTAIGANAHRARRSTMKKAVQAVPTPDSLIVWRKI